MAAQKKAKKVAKNAKKKIDDLSPQQKVGIGVGLTAAAVAAAGAYFLYGSDDASKNRKKVKSWTLRAKAEVLETLEKAEKMTENEYDKLIDSVSGAYSRLKDASKVDIATFKREMKDHWGDIEKVGKPMKAAAISAVMGATKKSPAKPKPKKKAQTISKKLNGQAVKKTTKKVAKKPAKKVVKKTTKKRTTKK